jgi:hypothetical protein
VVEAPTTLIRVATAPDIDARLQLLGALGQAADELAQALAFLTEAFEQLDDQQGDRLEEALFRPVQRAYGRIKRAYAGYAERHAIPAAPPAVPPSPAPSIGVKGLIDSAVETIRQVDGELVMLQDSLMLVELGDADLRGGLAEVRQALAGVFDDARAFLRTFGR